jgi:DNA polymerase-3 subunit epsilon
LADPDTIIIDTETTGLKAPDIVSFAAITIDGRPLFNQRIRPALPIEAGAFAVHGHTLDSLADFPTWPVWYSVYFNALFDKPVVSYNVLFDSRAWHTACRCWDLPETLPGRWSCAMHQYAAWFGDWQPQRRAYKYQPLPGGDHTALGDCYAVLNLIRLMAGLPRFSAEEIASLRGKVVC